MRKRLLIGIPLALLIIGLLVVDGWLAQPPDPVWIAPVLRVDLGPWLHNGAICTAVVLVLTLAATHELVLIARNRGYRPFGRTALAFCAVLVVGPYVSFNLKPITGVYDESWALLWMAIALGWVFLLQALLQRTTNAIENIAITMFIIFYAGGLASFMTKLRMEVGEGAGVAALLFSVFLVKITDAGAYFTGRAWGRHPLVPWLSPKKTWEGFVGGVVVAAVCALTIGHWLHVSDVLHFQERYVPHLWALAMLGILLGLFSAAGDLCESLIKRDADVKDSGQSLPGLGGVLDVLDSPLLAAPVAWVFWTRIIHVV